MSCSLGTNLTRTFVLFAACAVWCRSLAAQRHELSIGYGYVTSAGDGVLGKCFDQRTRKVISGRVSTALWSFVSAALTVRTPHFGDTDPHCTSTVLPPNTTFVHNDRVDLLTTPFTASDLRVAAQLGTSTALRLSVGGGNTWRSGSDVPYVLAAAQLLVRPATWWHLALEVEEDRFRVTDNPLSITYRDGLLVSAEPLGRRRRWSHAASLGIMLGLRL